MKCLTRPLAVFVLLFAGGSLYSQSLNEKYTDLIQRSETYEQYKVIPKTSLDGFWVEVMDSIAFQNNSLADLRAKVRRQNQKIESLAKSQQEVQAKLDESLTKNDSIRFLGVSLSKLSYHLIVWSLILILASLGILAYTMFFRSNKLTVRHKKDLEELELEFEKHRNAAREKQVKLKRELQTALNQLETRGKAVG